MLWQLWEMSSDAVDAGAPWPAKMAKERGYVLHIPILRSQSVLGWQGGRGVVQQDSFSASGWRGTAGCWQGHHHRA